MKMEYRITHPEQGMFRNVFLHIRLKKSCRFVITSERPNSTLFPEK